MFKKSILLFVSFIIGFISFAAPTVTDVVAKQRYPWNGLVDISCKVSGYEEGAKRFEFLVSAIVPDLGITNNLSHIWVVKNGEKSTVLTVTANGNYRILWDAKADLGEERYTNMVVSVTVKNTMDVQLWAGGPYWATTNIGAEEPWEYGYYFWWGDTIGYKRENDKWVATDRWGGNFSFNGVYQPTSQKSISTLQSEGWITADGVLAPRYDAARVHRGYDWHMPTKQEFDDLNNKCDWTWTAMNGVNGYVVRGRGEYESNSIFLPCAGCGKEDSLRGAGSGGYYWSSVPNSSIYDTWSLYFNSSSHNMVGVRRDDGLLVRPLRRFTK
jgi:hypothetical protein